jgi:hypothetical protein
MVKPNEYDNTQAGGAYEVPEVGGHHMIIKQVSEMKNKKGMIMVGAMEMIQVAILIGIAVVIGLIFKTEVTTFVNNTFSQLNG